MIEIDVVRYGDGQSTSSWDALSAIASTSLSLAYEPYLSREDDDDVTDIGKHDFCSGLLHPLG